MSEENNENRLFNLKLTMLTISAENHHTWISIGNSFAFGLIVGGAVLNDITGLKLACTGALLYVCLVVAGKISINKIEERAADIEAEHIHISEIEEEAEEEDPISMAEGYDPSSILFEALLLGVYGNWLVEIFNCNIWFTGLNEATIYNFLLVVTLFGTLFTYFISSTRFRKRMFFGGVHWFLVLLLSFSYLPEGVKNIMFRSLGPIIWFFAVVIDPRNPIFRDAVMGKNTQPP